MNKTIKLAVAGAVLSAASMQMRVLLSLQVSGLWTLTVTLMLTQHSKTDDDYSYSYRWLCRY